MRNYRILRVFPAPLHRLLPLPCLFLRYAPGKRHPVAQPSSAFPLFPECASHSLVSCWGSKIRSPFDPSYKLPPRKLPG
ncbi:hypothetical protein GALMADRAFT_1049068 [Galerina marginata CBS 339.88]|uniref:Uncharacterized protein n=1 Tax=Galerina marginata (strain CBS 339.88) TaxID=685588 RepID=A0A067SE11_GALM3|nr:hypothetical protein GALMADRAFT_1049068 [Galerina marginata CBS 339.88]